MRAPTLMLIVALAAGPAAAQSHRPLAPVEQVTVSIAAELEAKAGDLGQRDLDDLAAHLKRDVEQQLARHGRLGHGGAQLNLQIVDAKPSHPTMAQMKPGLDMIRSRSLGGATIRGEEVGPTGRRSVSFSLYENDIRAERGTSTWGDAELCFENFARDYALGRR